MRILILYWTEGIPRASIGWERFEIPITLATGNGSTAVTCQCRSGTCLGEMRTARGLTAQRAGCGQTPTAWRTSTSCASTVSTHNYNYVTIYQSLHDIVDGRVSFMGDRNCFISSYVGNQNNSIWVTIFRSFKEY